MGLRLGERDLNQEEGLSHWTPKGVVLTQWLPYACPPKIVPPHVPAADNQTLPVSPIWVEWCLRAQSGHPVS